MDSKRDNLVLAERNFTGTHYHDKSYHKCLVCFNPGSTHRHQSRTFTFSVNVGQRCTLAESWGDLPSAEIDWFR